MAPHTQLAVRNQGIMRSENTIKTSNTIHADLSFAKGMVYDKCDFELMQLKAESESAEYGAYTFRINNLSVKFRVAKTTPKKTGQFVAIWKRNQKGITEPFSISDDLDLVVISTRTLENFGQFIFPKSVLFDKGIISGNNKEGKRGIRVYPPWDKAPNRQAERTQKWQLEYFMEIANDNSADLNRTKALFT